MNLKIECFFEVSEPTYIFISFLKSILEKNTAKTARYHLTKLSSIIVQHG